MKKKIIIVNIVLIILSLCINSINTIYAAQKSTSHSVSEVVKEGDSFIKKGESEENPIDETNLKNLSDTIYNVLLIIGIIIAFIIGGILGIQFIMGGVEGQADVKKALIPYVIGCVVVFGSFAIWKMIVLILK